MLASTHRTIFRDGDRAPAPSLLQRLRQGNSISNINSNSKTSSSPKRNSLLAPFRRRTESVSTVMSSNSMGAEDGVPAAAIEDGVAAAAAATVAAAQEPNILEWLQKECPADVLPVVLAFAGPQQVSALSKTNKHWNSLILREGTWRVMCEGLYKWKQGDPEPASWFDLYRYSPCVPVDYPSIPKALSIALDAVPGRPRRSMQKHPQQVRGVRILLRPGKYFLKQAIEVQALPGVVVSMETIELPKNLYRHVRHFAEITEQPLPSVDSPASTTTKRTPSFRKLFSCNRHESMEETDHEETDYTDEWMDGNPLAISQPKHATLILRSRRANEPAFRVRQGLLCLRNLEIQHNSHGLDIWNGNAAIQIQPPLGEDEHPIPVAPRPTVCLQHVHITSKSGRGIVNIDGGKVILRNCAVTDCAATGVYIGGPGSQAIVEHSDVIRNGVGNCTRRGIARGHSGIYLEQGIASIHHSNVSSNTLTGISVVSPDNAFLTLEESTLVCNGTYQLELPPPGTASRQRCVTNNNTLAVHGEARLRSGLTLTEPSLLMQLPSSVPPFRQPLPPFRQPLPH